MPTPARLTFSASAVGVAAGIVGAAAAALAGVRDVSGPVFVVATAAGLVLATAAVVARAQGRAGASPLAALTLVAVIVAGGAAAIIDFTGPRDAEWLWIGLLSAAAAVAAWATARAWHTQRLQPRTDDAPFSPEPPDDINRETVEVGLENVRWVLGDEQARGQSLQTRASGLAGFGGIIISLVAATVGTVARRHDLTSGQRAAVIVFLAYGLLLLVAAVAMLLLGVLVTRNIEVTAVSELKLYAGRGYMTHSPEWAQGRITSTLGAMTRCCGRP